MLLAIDYPRWLLAICIAITRITPVTGPRLWAYIIHVPALINPLTAGAVYIRVFIFY